METVVFKDKAVRPTDELIFAILGDKSDLWEKMLRGMHLRYSDITEQWNYYHDGKSWLFRVLRKKKTLCWVGVLQDTFRVTFYISDRGEELMESGGLSESIKETYRNAKRSKFGRVVSVVMADMADVEQVLELARIKLKLA